MQIRAASGMLVTGISHNGKQLIDATAADRCDNAKLGKSRPEI
jgi:hypothetical protein